MLANVNKTTKLHLECQTHIERLSLVSRPYAIKKITVLNVVVWSFVTYVTILVFVSVITVVWHSFWYFLGRWQVGACLFCHF